MNRIGQHVVAIQDGDVYQGMVIDTFFTDRKQMHRIRVTSLVDRAHSVSSVHVIDVHEDNIINLNPKWL